MEKRLLFRGNSYSDLVAFPADARREAGFELGAVQNNEEPSDWKPMPSVGAGVQELRIQDGSGVFRVIYVAKFEPAVFVLHCFQKKTQKTARSDLDLAKKRYNELVQELRHAK
ncbi:MAG: type II toxin-antitoxin system RelE/ParE family toxin [Hyphomicrobiales bacterium]|nr:MAG: type II toxin-antitoxin system RelE/ParE family toxin [Hyphomicrobiales bacterium]